MTSLFLILGLIFQNAHATPLTDNCSKTFTFQPVETLVPAYNRFLMQFPGSGFKNLTELQNSLSKAPKNFQPAVDLISSEQFEVVIRRPLPARESYATKNGLTNFHETRISKGDMGQARDESVQTALNRRSLVEASYLGAGESAYRNSPASAKPKYGYMRVPPEFKGGKDHIRASIYGEDAWVLKNDHVRTRTTFTLGDSLDRVRYNVPHAYLGDGRFQSFTTSKWDEGLIPWSHREILIPEVFSPLGESGILGVWDKMSDPDLKNLMKESGFESLTPYTRTTVFEDEGLQVWKNGARYVESQTFGPIAPADIKAFEFTTDPPTGGFLDFLEKHGIEIRDARSWPPKKWYKSMAEKNLMPNLDELQKMVGKKIRATTKNGEVTEGELADIYNIEWGGVLSIRQPRDSRGVNMLPVQIKECRSVELIQ